MYCQNGCEVAGNKLDAKWLLCGQCMHEKLRMIREDAQRPLLRKIAELEGRQVTEEACEPEVSPEQRRTELMQSIREG